MYIYIYIYIYIYNYVCICDMLALKTHYVLKFGCMSQSINLDLSLKSTTMGNNTQLGLEP